MIPLIFLVCAGIVIEAVRGLVEKIRVARSKKCGEQEQSYYNAVKQREEVLVKLQQEMKEYTAEMNVKSTPAYDGAEQSEDWLTAWLGQYKLRAEKKHIRFELETEKNTKLPFAKKDAVSIIGNLLDNALEACEMVEQPFVIVCFAKEAAEDDATVIEVRNSKAPHCHPIENHFQTGKPDKDVHGNGVRIVEALCQRYDYRVGYEDKGTMFIVRVQKTEEG